MLQEVSGSFQISQRVAKMFKRVLGVPEGFTAISDLRSVSGDLRSDLRGLRDVSGGPKEFHMSSRDDSGGLKGVSGGRGRMHIQ